MLEWKGRVPFHFVSLSLSLRRANHARVEGRVPPRSHCERITAIISKRSRRLNKTLVPLIVCGGRASRSCTACLHTIRTASEITGGVAVRLPDSDALVNLIFSRVLFSSSEREFRWHAPPPSPLFLYINPLSIRYLIPAQEAGNALSTRWSRQRTPTF
ncbi:hypothetical protein EVAR_60058_1 [Eumeta japonica]|uniref:Uncharacterized protein n=1 Tax=Eumeta variegata TaxID=151549 RepID=A0A4C1ZHR2_EUMVA|nr:hypothetical protein EVAR_60058_1 [Eumeta japonica]